MKDVEQIVHEVAEEQVRHYGLHGRQVVFDV